MDDAFAAQPCQTCLQVTSTGCSLPDRVKKTKVRRKLLRRGHCDLWKGKKDPYVSEMPIQKSAR